MNAACLLMGQGVLTFPFLNPAAWKTVVGFLLSLFFDSLEGLGTDRQVSLRCLTTL